MTKMRNWLMCATLYTLLPTCHEKQSPELSDDLAFFKAKAIPCTSVYIYIKYRLFYLLGTALFVAAISTVTFKVTFPAWTNTLTTCAPKLISSALPLCCKSEKEIIKKLQCDYCNRAHLDKVDQSEYRKITINSKKAGCGPISSSDEKKYIKSDVRCQKSKFPTA